jgi:hypothetical protein
MQHVEGVTNNLIMQLNQHIEEFASAFAKRTDLPPDKIVMIVQQKITENGLELRIWFEEKGKTK